MTAARVERGLRQRQALAYIKQQEKDAAPWGTSSLAAALGISKAHASALLQSLLAKGALVRGPRTVVLEDAVCVAGGAQ